LETEQDELNSNRI